MPDIYKPTKGSRLTDEQVARYGPRLDALSAKGGGQLTAAAVLKDARSKRSPLHDFFQWDDAAAAEQFRLRQAAYLLRSITIEVTKDDRPPIRVRAFYHIDPDEEEGGHYAPLAVVVDRPEYREQLLARAVKELREMRRRYRMLQELDRIWAAIEEAECALASTS